MTLHSNHAATYANGLLSDLGETIWLNHDGDHPAIAWKRSGLMKATGLMLPLPLAAHVDGALMALRAICPGADDLPDSGALLMGERARLRETVRTGRFCAGGYGRLLDTQDGRIALNLVRDDDWTLIPAWLEDYVDDWDGIEKGVCERTTEYLVERASELGLAVAKDKLPDRPKSWFSKKKYAKATPKSSPSIVDLSGLWAGPLASSLLQMTGAKVIKVEGPERPDGMRNGHAGFYALINSRKSCVSLNFRNNDDLQKLKQLLHAADIVIEASRPRALPQIGIIAEDFMAAKPGKIWARLTAYGQSENRIGFGDDIGISAGLATIMDRAHGEPCFVGDAIADPINGIHLALVVQSMWRQGGGALIDLAMVDVLRHTMGEVPDNLSDVANEWNKYARDNDENLYPLRKIRSDVRVVGADNEDILGDL